MLTGLQYLRKYYHFFFKSPSQISGFRIKAAGSFNRDLLSLRLAQTDSRILQHYSVCRATTSEQTDVIAVQSHPKELLQPWVDASSQVANWTTRGGRCAIRRESRTDGARRLMYIVSQGHCPGWPKYRPILLSGIVFVHACSN